MGKSSKFKREGYDIYSDVAISFTQAALGGEVKTAGLRGPIILKVSRHLADQFRTVSTLKDASLLFSML